MKNKNPESSYGPRREPGFGIFEVDGRRKAIQLEIAEITAISTHNGNDISAWNWPMDFDIMAAMVDYTYIRAGFATYRDVHFTDYKAGLRAQNVPFGIYWYIKPGATSVREQVNAFVAAILEGGWVFPPAVDVETTLLGVHDTTVWVRSFMEMISGIFPGLRFVIYTSPGWWNVHIERNNWAKNYYLWVAHWTPLPTPTLPLDWTACLMWQWSAEGNGLGQKYGSGGESDMDLDRFMGTEEQWNEFTGGTTPPPPPPDEDPKFRVDLSGLYIRKSPVNGAIVGRRTQGEIVEQGDYELWIKDAKGWSAVRSGGQNYMTKL